MQIQKNQTAVITGAGSGIGRALALLCAARGMRVVVADIEADAAKRTAAAITDNGGQALAIATDVSSDASIAELAERTWSVFGGCQLLCNNAGVSINKPLDICNEADWRWVLDVNLMGVANAITHFLPRMKAQGEQAHIVNTASMLGLASVPEFGPYVASKYAVVGLSEVLQLELAGSNVGISILCPGVVETQIYSSERNRPDSAPPPPKPKEDMSVEFDTAYTRLLQAEQVAEIVLAGVEAERFYILTHPEWLSFFRSRADAIIAAFQS